MNTNHIKVILVGFLLLLSSSAGATLIVPTKSTLQKVGSTPVTVADIAGVSAPVDGATYNDITKKGLITLAVDHHYPTVITEGHTTVELEVTTYDAVGGSPNTPFTITLEVDYLPGTELSFNDRQIYELDGILAYDIEVISITGSDGSNLPANLYIDVELFVDRVYDFTDILDDQVDVEVIDNSKIIDNDCDDVKDAVLVRWTPITEAEEYQLEWTYVNDYTEVNNVYKDADEVKFDFRFNSSRISTVGSEYKIPLTYDHGYVVYRVRAVGRYIDDPTKRQYSLWSLPQNGFVDPDAGDDFYQIQNAWEISKNWQYSVTFAEEGKRKEVVSFFDGSLRNRQMVTLVSTNNKAIVGETFYDHQGRPVIQALPVPVSQPDPECTDGNNTLKYYQDFNKSALTSLVYSRSDFDVSHPLYVCDLVAGAMNTSSGAAKYYSADNPEFNGAQGYLPDAAGFPFSQVEYTADNTGRIRRQGGVGETFQLGSDHESKYYYGHPAQVELDRLFGSEVGYAVHYQKNMVVDPNGQVSVSYLDQEGRVVATALAGESPDNLIALESLEHAGLTLTDNILTPTRQEANTLSSNLLSKTVNETILISSPTNLTINYSEQIAKFTDSCLAENICFGCIYDLTIEFKDECGVSLVDPQYVDTLVGHFATVGENDSIVFTLDCTEESPANMPVSIEIPLVPIGSYQLNKTLTLNKAALDYYTQLYLSDTINTCFKTLEDFQEEYLADADFSGCVPDTSCQECLDALPELADFVHGGYGSTEDYQFLVNKCNAICNPVSMYESFRGFLLMDMHPGGQYGEYLTPSGTVHPENFALSVYNEGNNLPRSYYTPALASGIADWQTPVFERSTGTEYNYYDENMGTVSRIDVDTILNGSGVLVATVPPVVSTSFVYLDLVTNEYYTTAQNLSDVADFIDNFQPSWANSLIYYHPEYHILKTYEQMTFKDTNEVSSESFDALMEQADTWQTAIDLGLIRSDYTTTVLEMYEDYTDVSTSHAYDPFLVELIGDTVKWTHYKNLLLNKMGDYQTVGSSRTMAEIAAMINRCELPVGGSPGGSCFEFGYDDGGSTKGGTDPEDVEARNADWLTFRSLYRSLKQQYISEISIQRSLKVSDYYGYNGCIGNSDFNPFAGGFFQPPGGTQYLNPEQPCFVNNVSLYASKVKRFMLPSDVTQDGYGSGNGFDYSASAEDLLSNVQFQQYMTTGECPVSVGLAGLISDLAAETKLTDGSFDLTQNQGFVGFVAAYTGITNPPTALPDYTWDATIVDDSTLTVDMKEVSPPGTIASFIFRLYEDSLIVWDSISSITGFQAIATGGLGYTFTAKAVHVHGDTTDYYPMFGSTDLDILNCTFPDLCTRNELGADLFDLFNAVSGNLLPASPYDIKGGIADPDIELFVTDRIAETLSGTTTPASGIQWDFASGSFVLAITGTSGPTARTFEFSIDNPSPAMASALPNVVGFSDLVVTGSNTFTLKGVDITGVVITEIECTAAIFVGKYHDSDVAIGSCDQPAVGCDEPAMVNFNDLSALLEDVLLNQSPSYDLFASSSMTENIAGQLVGLTSTTSSSAPEFVYGDGLSVTPIYFDHQTVETIGDHIVTKTYYGEITATHVIAYTDSVNCGPGETGAECDSVRLTDSISRANPIKINTTTISLGEDCDLVMKLRENPLLGYDLDDITDVFAFEVSGDPDMNGDFHEFKIVVELNDTDTDTVFGETCLPIHPCSPMTNTFSGGEPFPNVVITDPCTAIVTSLAYAAAEDAFEFYADSVSTSFKNRYIAHCMSTVEEFSRIYDQTEHHFTLYYYDQAGNLVKTVPPEGVEQLDITASTDPIAEAIEYDRSHNEQKVITNHRMATFYAYNSLNQLTAQHMPDQDDMSSWEQTLANGLNVDLTTTAIQMLSASVGYLTGYVTTSDVPTGSRGYLYKTTDGGNNWTRVTNLFPYDLLKVRMATTDVGFAVGKSGVALRTVDGGTTWDLMDMHSKGIIGDFADVAVKGSSNAAFLMANGHIVPFIGGSLGSEYTPANPAVPSGSGAVTLRAGNSISDYNSTDVYSVNLEFVTGTSPDTLRFTHMALVNVSTPAIIYDKIKGNEWASLNYSSSSLGVIAGIDGDLVFLSEVGTGGRGTQFMQSSNIIDYFVDAAFLDKTTGVALASDGSDSYFYKTFDKGVNWVKVSASPALTMTVVSQTSTELYVAVSYTDGSVEYYEMTSAASNLLWTEANAGAFTTFTSYANGSNYYLVGCEGLDIVKSASFMQAGTSSPSFSIYYTYSSGTTPTRLEATEISGTIHTMAVRTVSSAPVVQDAYKIGAASVAIRTISPSSTQFRDLALGTNGGNYLLGYETNNQKIHRMTLSSSAPPSGALKAISLSASTLPGSLDVIAMGLHGNYVTVMNANGDIYSDTVGISSSSTANLIWRDRSDLRMTPIRAASPITYPYSSPDHGAIAVGDRGVILERGTTLYSPWRPYASAILTYTPPFFGSPYTGYFTPRLTDVASVSISTIPYAVIVGDQGTAKTWDLDNDMMTDIGTEGYTLGSAPTFRGVAINDAGNAVITSPNNKAYYCSDFTDGSPTSATISTGSDVLNGVSFPNGSSTAIAVGKSGRVASVSSSLYTVLNGVYGPALQSVHFASTNIGTVAGDNYFVRSTGSGGSAWSRVLPATINSTNLTKDVSDVWTRVTATNAHYAALGGTNYLGYAYNNVATPDAGYTPATVEDIEFSTYNPNLGYFAVGSTLKKIELTVSGSTFTTSVSAITTDTLPANINAIHVFSNNNHTSELMLVGNNMIEYLEEGATSTVSMLGGIAGNIRDVVFTDVNHGYVAGDGGLFYQTDAITYDLIASAYTAMSWMQRDVHDDETGTLSNINITALEFPTASHGVWGGFYTTSPGSAYAAARVLGVQNQSYSARFFYDRLGRIVVSQNSRQNAVDKYSYTLYDALGRVYEAGEKTENETGSGVLFFADIFGTSVGGQYVGSVVDDQKLNDWITEQSNNTRKEVTRSYYDEANIAINANGFGAEYGLDPATQRKRIVHVTYEAAFDSTDATYDHATHYDYDIHGNVKTLVQDNPKLGALADLSQHRFKQFDYTYDLISGNVHRVDYETGQADQWHHAYSYDADNRITKVYTTTATPLTNPDYGVGAVMMEPLISTYWTKEAEYQYYDHGPLARAIIGEHEVQGLDYVYTLQGWIKGVNSNDLNATHDPGHDGGAGGNHAVARDVSGYSLHYYAGDFDPVQGGNNGFVAGQSGSDLTANSNDLYNGNIGKMITTITNPNTRDILPLGTAYKYDQLNRLKEAVSFTNLSSNDWGSGGTGIYGNYFAYDANGNITKQLRKDENAADIDSLTYRYHTLSNGKAARNRLYHVDDQVGDGAFTDDINDMGTFDNGGTINTANNYSYDQEGRLIKDEQEEIESIVWRVDGKVKSIIRPDASDKKNITFEYDAMGHRIAKHVYSSSNILEKSTYYMLDAQGNTMATYEREIDSEEESIAFTQKEKYIYGSSRLGVYNDTIPMLGSQNNHEIVDRALPLDEVETVLVGDLCASTGKWYYESSGTTGSASGNVATFRDDYAYDSWMSAQVTATVIPGETYTLSFDLSNEVNLSYQHYEVRDCVGGLYLVTPTSGPGTYTATFTVPTTGSPSKIRIKFWGEQVVEDTMGFSLSNITLDGPGVQFSTETEYERELLFSDYVGKRNYEISNHLGNVLSVISDKVTLTDGTSVLYENAFDNIPDNFIYENDFSSSLDGFYLAYGTGSSSIGLSSGHMEAIVEDYGVPTIILPTTAGHKYMVSYDYDLSITATGFGRAAETTSGTILFQQYQEYDGTYNYLFEATSSSSTIYFAIPAWTTMTLDDFSVNDVTGEATYEPFYGSYSVSLSIEGNRLKAEHIGTYTQPSMSFASVSGHTYRATATLDVDAGSNFNFVATDPTTGTLNNVIATSDNTYSFDFTATGSSCRVDFQSSASGEHTLYIDDFIIEDITTTVAFLADIRQASDYSPFGVQLSGRNFTKTGSKEYRHGYQGSEEDDEVKGDGNSYTTEFRQLDPRLGRWLSIDPVNHPNQSPYCSMDNRPIVMSDALGANGEVKVNKDGNNKDRMTMSNTVVLWNADPANVTAARMQQVATALQNQVATIGTDPGQHFQVDGYSNLRITGTVTVLFANSEAQALQMAMNLCDGNVFGVVETGDSYVDGDGDYAFMRGQLSWSSTTGGGNFNYAFAHEWLHLFGLADRYVQGVELNQTKTAITGQGPVPISVPGDGEYYTKNHPNIMVNSVGTGTNATDISKMQVDYLLQHSNVRGINGFNPTQETMEFINEYKDGVILNYSGDYLHIWQPNPGFGYYDGTTRSTKSGKDYFKGLNQNDQNRITNYVQ